jgi:hypothetical protein
MLALFVGQQSPRRAVELIGERFERRHVDALQDRTTQDVVRRGDRQAGVFVELVRVGDAPFLHLFRDDCEVPSNHELQDSLKFPIAPHFKLAYNTVTPQRSTAMTKMTFSTADKATSAAAILAKTGCAVRVDGAVVTTNAKPRDRKAVAEVGMLFVASFTGYEA